MEVLVVSVKDSFEIKPNMAGSNHEPGLVVVFDGRQCGFQLPSAGAVIELIRPDGVARRSAVTEMKEHGEGRSFFLPGLKRDDAPVGTVIYWDAEAVQVKSTAAAAGG